MLQRHSSRRTRLDQSVLNQRLEGAVSYDRIAGYFRSSLFEVAGEALSKVTGPIRIICNSDIDPQDMATAAAAQAGRPLETAQQPSDPRLPEVRRQNVRRPATRRPSSSLHLLVR